MFIMPDKGSKCDTRVFSGEISPSRYSYLLINLYNPMMFLMATQRVALHSQLNDTIGERYK